MYESDNILGRIADKLLPGREYERDVMDSAIFLDKKGLIKALMSKGVNEEEKKAAIKTALEKAIAYTEEWKRAAKHDLDRYKDEYLPDAQEDLRWVVKKNKSKNWIIDAKNYVKHCKSEIKGCEKNIKYYKSEIEFAEKYIKKLEKNPSQIIKKFEKRLSQELEHE